MSCLIVQDFLDLLKLILPRNPFEAETQGGFEMLEQLRAFQKGGLKQVETKVVHPGDIFQLAEPKFEKVFCIYFLNLSFAFKLIF